MTESSAPTTQPSELQPLLEVEHLGVRLPVDGELRPILRNVTLSIGVGESLGIVGESGSGKSMTVRAVDRLLPRGAKLSGSIRFRGRDVQGLTGADLTAYRGHVAMIFQDPRAHINPMRSIGQFMVEALVTTGGVSKVEATRRAVASLSDVGVDRPERRLKQYPHELSGGLLQRVMIAAALLTEPSLLLADEPTTALDVTTQSEVMAIVNELRRERGMAMIFISHDLDLAAAVCDRTAVMYAGSVVELNSSMGLHDFPLHPYTAALGTARPSLTERSGRLTVIPGAATSASDAPDVGCAYASRCAHVASVCTDVTPQLRAVGRGATRCVRSEEVLGHA